MLPIPKRIIFGFLIILIPFINSLQISFMIFKLFNLSSVKYRSLEFANCSKDNKKIYYRSNPTFIRDAGTVLHRDGNCLQATI